MHLATDRSRIRRPRIRRLRARHAYLPALALLIGTVGCADDSTTSSDTSADTSAETSTTVATADSSAASSSQSVGSASSTTADDASSSTAQKVSANDATIEELTDAFTEAGVANASRWAREVDEYRPYETSDTEFGALYEELSKYGIDDETFNKIVSVLEL